jgi:hypothetical protein
MIPVHLENTVTDVLFVAVFCLVIYRASRFVQTTVELSG